MTAAPPSLRQEKTDPRSENRVMGFQSSFVACVGSIGSELVDLHQEIETIDTASASGVRRWLAKDPILFAGGQANLYEYCDGNPIRYFDPYGLEVRVHNRRCTGVLGWFGANHAYLESTETGRIDGMNGSSGRNAGAEYTENVDADPYNVIDLPEGVSEDEFMDHFHETKNDGMWFPVGNDCHQAIDATCNHFGATNPGAPGGRLGPCPPVEPDPPESPPGKP